MAPVTGPGIVAKTLTPLEAGAYLRAAGITDVNLLAFGITVGRRESTFITNNTHANSNGTTDYGIWQINSSHADIFPGFFPPSTLWSQPFFNAVAFQKMYAIQGAEAWVSSGGSQPLPEDLATARQVMGMPADHTGSAGTVDVVGGAVGGTLTWAQILSAAGAGAALGASDSLTGGNSGVGITLNPDGTLSTQSSIVDFATDPLGYLTKNLGSALWIGGGAILALLGVIMLAKNEINPIALAKLAA